MAKRMDGKLLLACSALSLAGCGGDGNSFVASIPPPAVAPAPTPTPPPAPPTAPIPPARLGLASDQPFAVLALRDSYKTDASSSNPSRLTNPTAVDVQFSYDSSRNSYVITLPGYDPATLVESQYNGSAGAPAIGSLSKLSENAFGFLLPVSVTLPVPGTAQSPLTYTSLGYWDEVLSTAADGGQTRAEGMFAYGIPTAVGDVPITGSASYSATISGKMDPGTSNAFYVGGTADLRFDFAAGTLSGSMHPRIDDAFDGIFIDFGTYNFRQTVYSSGSTTFSGKFAVPDLPAADSFFDGRFTGPGAAELMARFSAPYVRNSNQGVLSGVWLGKKN